MDSTEPQEVPEVASSPVDDSLSSAAEESVNSPPEEIEPSSTGESMPSPTKSEEAVATENVSPAKASPIEEIVEKPAESSEVATQSSSSSSCCCSDSCPLMNSQVQDLVHWRNPVHSAVVLCVLTSLLVLLRTATVLSMFSLWMLCMLLVTASYRIVIATVLTFQKKELVNPMSAYLSGPLPLGQEQMVGIVKKAISGSLNYMDSVRRRLLVENTRSSVMLFLNMLGLYQLTCWVSILTLATVAVIALFAIPPLYEKNKAQADPVLANIKVQGQNAFAQVKALPVVGPMLFPKPKTD